jgi:dihydroflavonol-4-reductase
MKTNVNGPCNVLEACRESGVKKLVHFSSIHAFRDPGDDAEVNETTPMADDDPDLCYDFSKASGQKSVQNASRDGLDVIVVNPGAVLGPNDFKPSRMGGVLMDIYRHKLPMLVDGGYNWVDVRDVVDGALAAEKKGRPGECYLLTGHWEHIGNVAKIIKRLYGVKVPEIILPLGLGLFLSYFASTFMKLIGRIPKFTPQAMRALRAHRNISCAKARAELGYNPRPLEETVKDTIDWFLAQKV